MLALSLYSGYWEVVLLRLNEDGSVDETYGENGIANFNINNNNITGTGGGDFLSGYAGNDTILGMNGNDYVDGGSGDDRLEGNQGNDYPVDENGVSRMGQTFKIGFQDIKILEHDVFVEAAFLSYLNTLIKTVNAAKIEVSSHVSP